MSKLICKRITKCSECPYMLLLTSIGSSICRTQAGENNTVYIPNIKAIPEWCPLSDDELTTSFSWMITQLKWQHKQTKYVEPDEVPEDMVEYSPELKKAMEVLTEILK